MRSLREYCEGMAPCKTHHHSERQATLLFNGRPVIRRLLVCPPAPKPAICCDPAHTGALIPLGGQVERGPRHAGSSKETIGFRPTGWW